jgi:hypothetical protein
VPGLGYSGSSTTQHQYQLVDTFDWTIGQNSIKFGADWRRLTPTWASQLYESGIQILGLDNIQQGYASTLFLAATAPGQPVFNNLSIFAQDHWRISPRLSVDLGLRWEFNPPPGPSNGHYPATLTSSNLATATIAPPGTAPYQTSYDHFAPRFGFAWSAIPSIRHSLTVRGGFGIFYDTGQQTIGNAYASVYPFSATAPIQDEIPLPLSAAVLAPPSLNFPLTPPYPYLQGLTARNLTLPYTEQWNLSVDEALSEKNTLTVSYVGNVGRKLLFTNYYGSVPANPDFSGGLTFTSNGSQSSYNALQVQDRGRIANGLDFVGSFTWAHALDDVSNDFAENAPMYGNSDNDLRRVLNFALNYQMPTLSSHGWIQAMTRGWLLANRFSAQSGFPLNVVQDYAYPPDAPSEEYLPDLVPGVPIYLHGRAADVDGQPVPGNWRLNSAAFALVPTDPTTGIPIRQGTLGRNFVRSPGFWTLNTAVQRSFHIREELHLIFRVDAFNIFNHPNLNQIDTTLSDSTFGQSNGGAGGIGSSNLLYAMGAARSLQFSLKLQF